MSEENKRARGFKKGVSGNPYEAFTKGIMIAANFKKAQGEVGNDDRFHEKDEA